MRHPAFPTSESPARFPAHHTFMTLILPELARNLLPVVQVLALAAIAFAAWRPRPARAA